MLKIIWILLILAVELVAPKYISAIIAIGNMFLPDMVPYIDEILGAAILLRKFIDE